jgi:hypothetical protein
MHRKFHSVGKKRFRIDLALKFPSAEIFRAFKLRSTTIPIPNAFTYQGCTSGLDENLTLPLDQQLQKRALMHVCSNPKTIHLSRTVLSKPKD